MNIQFSGFWRRQSIVIIFLIVTLALISIFVTRPLLSNINETKRVLVLKNDELSDLQDKTIKLQKIAKTTDPDESYVKVSHLLPDNAEVGNFIIQLENLSTNRQVLIKDLSIAEIKNIKEIGKVTPSTQFFFDFDANYQTLLQLVRDLESFERFNSIETINLLSQDNQAIAVKISGRIFYGK